MPRTFATSIDSGTSSNCNANGPCWSCKTFVDRIDADALREFDLWDLNAEAVAWGLHEALPEGLAIDAAVPAFRTAIFEGAQGVLLDEYRGFHPYTTWNTVTPHHAWELVHATDVEAVAVLGITRAYTTRHGAGAIADILRRID